MTSIAIIGPDGAGKTTIARRLADDPSLKVEYVYLGVNPEASNRMLFTTRAVGWWKRRRGNQGDHGPPPDVDELVASVRPTPLKEAKSTLRVLNQVADEWYRQAVATVAQWRGFVVVFDRHYLADYSQHDMGNADRLPFHRRLHGFVLRNLYPRPDAIVLLDAPPSVLLARKGEGTLAALERRRRDYHALESTTENFFVVDAARDLPEVYAEVVEIIAGLELR